MTPAARLLAVLAGRPDHARDDQAYLSDLVADALRAERRRALREAVRRFARLRAEGLEELSMEWLLRDLRRMAREAR